MFYTLLNFINVDDLIVEHNFKMYRQTGKVDISYIQDLSDDAIPEMVDYAIANDTPVAGQLRRYLLTRKKDFKANGTWQSFNYSRYKAREALSNYR